MKKKNKKKRNVAPDLNAAIFRFREKMLELTYKNVSNRLFTKLRIDLGGYIVNKTIMGAG